jgi:hypothetical protein
MSTYRTFFLATAVLALAACERSRAPAEPPAAAADPLAARAAERLKIYAPVRLSADLGALTANQRRLLAKLIEASEIMDALFWKNAYPGDKDALLASLADPAQRRFAEINYGPWDRLDGDRPFVSGVGDKPLGANFYPVDMSKAEFEAWRQPGKDGQYSLVRRDAEGRLSLVPFHVEYRVELERAAALLREAAALAEDAGFRNYLELRATALVTDDFRASDLAWMDMKQNRIDVVIGPIENYEDALYGYRTAYEAYVLLKDMAWSERLARFAKYLPELQRGLPVPDRYRRETPGTDSDLNAYDVLYYAGHSNAGSKTIAINLPNDEQVQLQKGTRRLQLKNAMRAKFDQILVPIARELIAEDQRANVKFDAFFANVMFHEVAHGLGVKNTVDGKGTVRAALKEHHNALEEGKADVLGLYMITALHDKGELKDTSMLDHYVTFLAGFMRSVRFGASSAHGRANMVQFNFLAERGAFSRDAATGTYRIDEAKMAAAVRALAARILTLQGDGDYAGVTKLFADSGVIRPELAVDLERLKAADIPVDIHFEQGTAVLGPE